MVDPDGFYRWELFDYNYERNRSLSRRALWEKGNNYLIVLKYLKSAETNVWWWKYRRTNRFPFWPEKIGPDQKTKDQFDTFSVLSTLNGPSSSFLNWSHRYLHKWCNSLVSLATWIRSTHKMFIVQLVPCPAYFHSHCLHDHIGGSGMFLRPSVYSTSMRSFFS